MLKTNATQWILLAAFLAVITPAVADSPIGMESLISGRNVYAPAVLNGRIWYGGWQGQYDYPYDRIYVRSLQNPQTHQTVLTPWSSGGDYVHVNDPSITLHYNQASGTWQYTMFYTACYYPCEQYNNEIWSAVSTDGVNWSYHHPLLYSEIGPAEPSAVLETDTDGAFWKVYYVDRLDATVVKMVRVDGNRNAVDTRAVYQDTTGHAISSVDVKYFNGKWQLFFNKFYSMPTYPDKLDRIDLFKVESSTNLSWTNTPELVITNPGYICSSLTPTVVPLAGDPTQYDLYFGMSVRKPSGECELDNLSIQRWRMVD